MTTQRQASASRSDRPGIQRGARRGRDGGSKIPTGWEGRPRGTIGARRDRRLWRGQRWGGSIGGPRKWSRTYARRLTTPHKLQGRGSVSKPVPGTGWLCLGCRKATAAPCQLHAVVMRPSLHVGQHLFGFCTKLLRGVVAMGNSLEHIADRLTSALAATRVHDAA